MVNTKTVNRYFLMHVSQGFPILIVVTMEIGIYMCFTIPADTMPSSAVMYKYVYLERLLGLKDKGCFACHMHHAINFFNRLVKTDMMWHVRVSHVDDSSYSRKRQL